MIDKIKIEISGIVGDYAEKYVSHYLIKKGWDVYRNQSSNGVDLIAMKNRLIKIQVKASTLMKISTNHDGYCFQIREKRSNKIYDVDYFAFCFIADTLNIEKVLFIPIDKIKNLKSSCLNIKSGNTKWNKYKNLRFGDMVNEL